MQILSNLCIRQYCHLSRFEKCDHGMKVLLMIALLCSCNATRPSRGTEIKKAGGLQHVENKTERFSLGYYGDYWFHSFRLRNSINMDKVFLQSLYKTHSKTTCLFSGNTTLEPYGSSIGMLYKSATMSDDLKNIKLDLRQRLRVENFRDTMAIVGSHSFEILSYSIQNKTTQVNNQYLEYYISRESDFLRITFWTIDSRGAEWLKNESEAIMAKLEID
jgi:hypothetical protein